MARYFYSYPYIKYKTHKTSGIRELRAEAGNLSRADFFGAFQAEPKS